MVVVVTGPAGVVVVTGTAVVVVVTGTAGVVVVTGRAVVVAGISDPHRSEGITEGVQDSDVGSQVAFLIADEVEQE